MRLPFSVREPPADPKSEVSVPVFVIVPDHSRSAGCEPVQEPLTFVSSIEPAFVNPAGAVT